MASERDYAIDRAQKFINAHLGLCVDELMVEFVVQERAGDRERISELESIRDEERRILQDLAPEKYQQIDGWKATVDSLQEELAQLRKSGPYICAVCRSASVPLAPPGAGEEGAVMVDHCNALWDGEACSEPRYRVGRYCRVHGRQHVKSQREHMKRLEAELREAREHLAEVEKLYA